MKKNIKYRLIFSTFIKFAVIGLLMAPALNQFFKIKEFYPLYGVQENKYQALKDSLDGKETFFNGTFQRLKSYELQEGLLIRNPMIKIRNQFEYTLFGKLNAEHLYYYGDQYFRFYSVDYHEGVLFRGEDEINNKIQKLMSVTKVLGDSIPVITVIAPNKAHLYSEYLPNYNTKQTEFSNYRYIKKILNKNNMHCLDFNQWFKEIKGTKEIPLMGNGGVHWSRYGSTIAMDSLVNYLNSITGKKFKKPTWILEQENDTCYHDNDAIKVSNLLFPQFDNDLRGIQYINEKNIKIKALIISDSFFDVISLYGLRDNIFTSDSKYDYYYGTQTGIPGHNQRLTPEDFKSYIWSVDCIIIMSDVVNLENYSWGFIEEAYEQLVIKQ